MWAFLSPAHPLGSNPLLNAAAGMGAPCRAASALPWPAQQPNKSRITAASPHTRVRHVSVEAHGSPVLLLHRHVVAGQRRLVLKAVLPRSLHV